MRQKKSQKPTFHRSHPSSRRNKSPYSQNRRASQDAFPDVAQQAKKGLVYHGVHPVMAALANPNRSCIRLFATQAAADRLDRGAIAPRHQHLADEICLLSREQMDRLTTSKSASQSDIHQGIALHLEPLEELDLTDITSAIDHDGEDSVRLVILDQVTDPRNIGAILRSALAFGARAVIMTRKHAPDETASLAKAAAGAVEMIPMVKVVNLARALDALQHAGICIAGLEAGTATPIDSLSEHRHLALILGAEGGGMRRLTREHCDVLTSIPISEHSESLNVSVAAAIALYASQYQP